MQKNIEKTIFDFLVIGFDLVALAFTEREYLSSSVNSLTNSLKTSHTSKSKLFELIFFHSGQKISQNYCHADLGSVYDIINAWLSISVLTRVFLGV